MDYTLINEDFGQSIKTMRKVLPKLAFGLLIGTYLISALIMGIFHAESSPNLGFKVAAFLVPLAIQVGRGALVFFFQLNPIHLQKNMSFGTIAATALLLLSLWEAYAVMSPYGQSWTISVSTLMLIGWILEIMLLRETAFATKWQLYQNQELWQKMKAFYAAEQEIEAVVKNGNLQFLSSAKTLPPQSAAVKMKKEEASDLPKPLDSFYGVELDATNPYLSLNLSRLENRFLERYHQSIRKDEQRRATGKASHKTTLQSIKDNKERFEQVRKLRHQLLGEELNLSISKVSEVSA